MSIAGIIRPACRPLGVRNGGSAFVPKYTWKCACGAHGTSKVEGKARQALDKHIAATIAELEKAFDAARKAENAAIDALPAHATSKQTDRCWALADTTNAARKALAAARDASAAG